jgi:putative FmdB family regulatory protein
MTVTSELIRETILPVLDLFNQARLYLYVNLKFREVSIMPIYEYECLQCGKSHEIMQKFSDAPLKACPECGGQMKKLISSTSFVLKGGGWYMTDYASTERKKAMESEKGTSDKKSSETKTETKTETKKEAVAAK